jgi:hypothetical protein
VPEVKIGQIVVTFDPTANTARITCGTVSFDIGSAAGQRFFNELTMIRDALKAAHKVLMGSALKGGEASPDEMNLLKLLINLDIIIYQDEIT